MSLPSAVIDAMVATGCSVEQLAAAMKAANAETEAIAALRRAKAAEKKRRQRASSRQMAFSVPGTSGDTSGQQGTPSPSDKDAPHTPQEINHPYPPSPPKGGSSPTRTANPAIVLQSVLDPMTAKSICDHFVELRKPLTSQSAGVMVETLRRVEALGANKVEAVRTMIAKRWSSLDVEWLRNSGMAFNDGIPPPAARGSPPSKPTLAAGFGHLATEMRQQREIRSGTSGSGVQSPILDLPAIRHG